jgi:hypothetical protein
MVCDSAGIADWMTTWGTLLAAAVAALAFVVAVLSYLDTSSSARRAHMHDLFRSYLEGPTNTRGEAEGTETTVSIRLYVLEEMFAWTEDERKVRLRLGSIERDAIESWRETVLTHAGYDFPKLVGNLCDYPQCYSLKFLEFLDAELTPERALAAVSGRYFRSGRELEITPAKLDNLLRDYVDADLQLASLVVAETARRRGSPQPHLPPEVQKLSGRIAELRKLRGI